MDKKLISNLLEEKHQKLFEWIAQQDGNYWEKGPENRWTAGQQIQHLVDSIKPLNLALSLPSFILKAKFGTTNRELRTYDEIVNKYNEKLIKFKVKARDFNSKVSTPDEKKLIKLVSTLKKQNKKLQYKTEKLSNYKLDNLILPHPLLGKMPLREIIMWTAHHTEHHTTDLIENYS
ncbi:DinB family protein [uncultured Tenacibaculum sp.]|uniref:DinB family protein n=1 Tax=uncultured Tenacibaculum sp. TaxID=174713 RepID=UPI002629021A|nr:DinB family protein [uncultured Tenacibaculum sp.]